MRYRSLAAVVAGLLLATATTATAFAAPAPDGFSRHGALPIELDSTESLDASSATGSFRTDSTCTSNAQSNGHAVWWKWTATVSGSIIADTSGSLEDTVLQVYDKGKKIACDDDSGDGNESLLTFVAQEGKTYSFGVAAYHDNAGGNVLLLLTENTATLSAVVGAPDSPNSCSVTVSGSGLLVGSDVYYNAPGNVLGTVAGDGTFNDVGSWAENPVTFYGTTASNTPIDTGELTVFCH